MNESPEYFNIHLYIHIQTKRGVEEYKEPSKHPNDQHA